MAERTNIPNSPACGQWETLLADALDGLLTPADEAVFTAHMAVCPACTALYEESQRGREWLEFLSPEPDVPAGLLDKILSQTGPGQIVRPALAVGSGNVLPMPPAWQRPGLVGHVRRFAEPRLMMTAAMAFFSIALTLNLTGVQLRSLRMANLRPSAVRSFMERRLTMASTPIVRYYDHLRFVYEVESRMRELRRATQGEGMDGNQEEPQKPKDAVPGNSKKSSGQKDGGSRMEQPQQSVTPAYNEFNDFSEASLTFQDRPAQSGGSATAVWERSTVWTA